jgi:drug/metabolite transporter (DMT)-like permease
MSYFFIAATIGLTVVGQILIKSGLANTGPVPRRPDQLLSFVLGAVTDLRVVAGLICALLAYVSWIGALAVSDLSFAYPFLALPVVVVLALSSVILGESISVLRWVGVMIVCVGLIIAAKG